MITFMIKMRSIFVFLLLVFSTFCVADVSTNKGLRTGYLLSTSEMSFSAQSTKAAAGDASDSASEIYCQFTGQNNDNWVTAPNYSSGTPSQPWLNIKFSWDNVHSAQTPQYGSGASSGSISYSSATGTKGSSSQVLSLEPNSNCPEGDDGTSQPCVTAAFQFFNQAEPAATYTISVDTVGSMGETPITYSCWSTNNVPEKSLIPIDLTTAKPALKSSAASLALGLKTFSSSNGTACYINDSGRIFCWGNGAYGLLGVENAKTGQPLSMSALPVAVPILDVSRKHVLPALGISVGPTSACAIVDPSAQGSGVKTNLYCWGYNDQGSLGTGVLATSVKYEPQPVEEPAGYSNVDFKQVSVGYLHTCAVGDYANNQGKKVSQLFCWGNNYLAQSGNNSCLGKICNEPVAIKPLGAVYSSISAGAFATCVAPASGGAACMGYSPLLFGSDSPLGLNPVYYLDAGFPPRLEKWTAKVLQISLPKNSMTSHGTQPGWVPAPYACALAQGAQGQDNQVYCWGLVGSTYRSSDGRYGVVLDYGQLGQYGVWGQDYAGKVALPEGFNPHSITTGMFRACALGVNRIGGNDTPAVYCWGAQLSKPGETIKSAYNPYPIQFGAVSPDTNSGLVLGGSTVKTMYLCYLGVDGQVYCAGNNTKDILGAVAQDFSGSKSYLSPTKPVSSLIKQQGLAFLASIDGAEHTEISELLLSLSHPKTVFIRNNSMQTQALYLRVPSKLSDTGSSCFSGLQLKPFEVCSLVLEVKPGSGFKDSQSVQATIGDSRKSLLIHFNDQSTYQYFYFDSNDNYVEFAPKYKTLKGKSWKIKITGGDTSLIHFAPNDDLKVSNNTCGKAGNDSCTFDVKWVQQNRWMPTSLVLSYSTNFSKKKIILSFSPYTSYMRLITPNGDNPTIQVGQSIVLKLKNYSEQAIHQLTFGRQQNIEITQTDCTEVAGSTSVYSLGPKGSCDLTVYAKSPGRYPVKVQGYLGDHLVPVNVVYLKVIPKPHPKAAGLSFIQPRSLSIPVASTVTLRLQNTGGFNLTDINISGGSAISISDNQCANLQTSLAPNLGCTFKITAKKLGRLTLNASATTGVHSVNAEPLTLTLYFQNRTYLQFLPANKVINTVDEKQLFKVLNVGTVAVQNIKLSSDSAGTIIAPNGCNDTTLAPGKSCQFGLTSNFGTSNVQVNGFIGDQVPIKATTLSITTNLKNPLAISPKKLVLKVGESKSVTLKNNGNVPLVTNISDSVGASITQGCQNITLQPGGACQFNVTGVHHGLFSLAVGVGSGKAPGLKLAVSVFNPETQYLRFEPGNQPFLSVNEGRTLSIINASPFTMSNVHLNLDDLPEKVHITNNQCKGVVLGPEDKCSFMVAAEEKGIFEITAAGILLDSQDASATLTVNVDPERILSLGVGQLSLAVGKEKKVTLTNEGTLSVNSIQLTMDQTAQEQGISIVNNSCENAVLGVKGSCSFTLKANLLGSFHLKITAKRSSGPPLQSVILPVNTFFEPADYLTVSEKTLNLELSKSKEITVTSNAHFKITNLHLDVPKGLEVPPTLDHCTGQSLAGDGSSCTFLIKGVSDGTHTLGVSGHMAGSKELSFATVVANVYSANPLSVSPSKAVIQVSAGKEQKIRLINTGKFTLDNITYQPSNDKDISIRNGCTGQLTGGDSCDLFVKSLAVGRFDIKVSAESSDITELRPVADIAFDSSIPTDALSFEPKGTIFTQPDKNVQLYLKNNAAIALQGIKINVPSGLSEAPQITCPDKGSTGWILPPSESCEIMFNSNEYGSFLIEASGHAESFPQSSRVSADLTNATDYAASSPEESEPSVEKKVVIYGEPLEFRDDENTREIHFINLYPGKKAALVIQNTGANSFVIDNATVVSSHSYAAPPKSFSISGSCIGSTLKSGNSCELAIEYSGQFLDNVQNSALKVNYSIEGELQKQELLPIDPTRFYMNLTDRKTSESTSFVASINAGGEDIYGGELANTLGPLTVAYAPGTTTPVLYIQNLKTGFYDRYCIPSKTEFDGVDCHSLEGGGNQNLLSVISSITSKYGGTYGAKLVDGAYHFYQLNRTESGSVSSVTLEALDNVPAYKPSQKIQIKQLLIYSDHTVQIIAYDKDQKPIYVLCQPNSEACTETLNTHIAGIQRGLGGWISLFIDTDGSPRFIQTTSTPPVLRQGHEIDIVNFGVAPHPPVEFIQLFSGLYYIVDLNALTTANYLACFLNNPWLGACKTSGGSFFRGYLADPLFTYGAITIQH